MVINHVLLSCILLVLIINLDTLNAAPSVQSANNLIAEENKILSVPSHRIRRQVIRCNRIGLQRNARFWGEHNQNLTFNVSEVNSNENVVVYSEKSLRANLEWVLDYITILWDYILTKTTYNDFKREACLAVVIHEGKYPGDQHRYAIDRSNNFLANILDLGSLTPNLWTDESKRNEAHDLITNQLAYFVEFSSNGRFGSPSSHIWKSPSSQDSAFVEIFTYDVYMNVQELKESALPYQNETLSKWHETTFPKNETFWFRDWFLPIYENYGGTTVLNNYFTILENYVPWLYYIPDNLNKMKMGEFVHFWSGAAGFDLAPLAWEAFGWNRTLERELLEAQQRYNLREPFLYNVTNAKYNWTSLPEGEKESTDGDCGNKSSGHGHFNITGVREGLSNGSSYTLEIDLKMKIKVIPNE